MSTELRVSSAKTSDDFFDARDGYSKTWREMFLGAEHCQASDILVNSYRGSIETRFIVNGECRLYRVIGEYQSERDLIKTLFVRLKDIAGLSNESRRRAGDSAFDLRTTGARYRAALTPGCGDGESIVFRVIRESFTPKLKDYNLSEDVERDFRAAIAQKQGLILITGPTGSGKSTLLQSGILELDRERLNIRTLENPVEKRIPGVVQNQITDEFGWADGIKMLMRQAPHVILVGEIRDHESATLALEAAQTGHLVLSTLHTNDVPGTVDRLLGMGVQRHILADNLIFVAAQRLEKVICQNCRMKGHSAFRRGLGCNDCGMSGLSGRVPLIEYSFRPDPKAIQSFEKGEFRRTQLRQTLAGEAKRQVNAGRLDEITLDYYLD